MISASELRLSELLDRYVRRKHSDPSTESQLRINVARIGQYLGRPATLSDFDNDTLEDMMYRMKGEGLSPRTCNKFRDNMQALWTFAAKNALIQTWPQIPKMPEPQRIPFAWTKDDLNALFLATTRLPSHFDVGGVKAAVWWNALLAVCYDSAERIGAVLALRWDDLRWHDGYIIARAESRKGKRSDKIHKLHPDTLAVLRSMYRNSDGPIFQWDKAPTHLWSKYKSILKIAGLPQRRDCMFHCLRKTSASWFAASGGDATALLGHCDRRTTLKYLDPTIDQKVAAADVLPRPVPLRIVGEGETA